MKKISKKTGLLATKLGYKDREDNWVFYSKQYKTWFSTNVKGGISGDEETFKQCTQSELQTWLRKKGFETWAAPGYMSIGYSSHYRDELGRETIHNDKFHTFEKALEVALYQGLKLLEFKGLIISKI